LTFSVSTVSVPPAVIASRALTTRFMITCSIWVAPTCTRPGSELSRMTSRMSSPIRRSSIFCMSLMTEFTSTTRVSDSRWRLKASSWRVSSVARSPARWISVICRMP
jgi:hypothetical protein